MSVMVPFKRGSAGDADGADDSESCLRTMADFVRDKRLLNRSEGES